MDSFRGSISPNAAERLSLKLRAKSPMKALYRLRLKFTHFRPIRPSGAVWDFGRRKRDQNEFTGSRIKGLRNKRRQSCPKLSSGNAHPLRASGN